MVMAVDTEVAIEVVMVAMEAMEVVMVAMEKAAMEVVVGVTEREATVVVMVVAMEKAAMEKVAMEAVDIVEDMVTIKFHHFIIFVTKIKHSKQFICLFE